jgi:hypothetical protein
MQLAPKTLHRLLKFVAVISAESLLLETRWCPAVSRGAVPAWLRGRRRATPRRADHGGGGKSCCFSNTVTPSSVSAAAGRAFPRIRRLSCKTCCSARNQPREKKLANTCSTSWLPPTIRRYARGPVLPENCAWHRLQTHRHRRPLLWRRDYTFGAGANSWRFSAGTPRARLYGSRQTAAPIMLIYAANDYDPTAGTALAAELDRLHKPQVLKFALRLGSPPTMATTFCTSPSPSGNPASSSFSTPTSNADNPPLSLNLARFWWQRSGDGRSRRSICLGCRRVVGVGLPALRRETQGDRRQAAAW